METRKTEIEITRVNNGYIARDAVHSYVGNNLTEILKVMAQNIYEEVHELMPSEDTSCKLEIKIIPMLEENQP